MNLIMGFLSSSRWGSHQHRRKIWDDAAERAQATDEETYILAGGSGNQLAHDPGEEEQLQNPAVGQVKLQSRWGPSTPTALKYL